MTTRRRPRVAVLYHYFHPDDVVSARHYTDLCLGLQERGWDVEALPSNRSCHHANAAYPLRETWRNITLRRVWRPSLRQSSSLGRVVNALWMMAAWCSLALRNRPNAPDVVIVGTDPVLSVLTAWVIRKLQRRIRLVHWCFDLYPEAAVAEGLLPKDGWANRLLRRLVSRAYASCDLIVDIGECMRTRLEAHGHGRRQATLVPWALVEPDEVEPADRQVRRELFGEAALGLLYSGNFGRAHSFVEFLELARRLRGSGVSFCFAGRGSRAEELRAAIQPEDNNVRLAGFAPEAELSRRLAAADIHLVSLRPEWSGVVVPSKFFGALAVGRPVLFAGPRDCAIARWIEEFDVGWVLNPASIGKVAAQMRELAANPERLTELRRHCHAVYQENFSRRQVIDGWHRELLAELTPIIHHKDTKATKKDQENGLRRKHDSV